MDLDEMHQQGIEDLLRDLWTCNGLGGKAEQVDQHVMHNNVNRVIRQLVIRVLDLTEQVEQLQQTAREQERRTDAVENELSIMDDRIANLDRNNQDDDFDE